MAKSETAVGLKVNRKTEKKRGPPSRFLVLPPLPSATARAHGTTRASPVATRSATRPGPGRPKEYGKDASTAPACHPSCVQSTNLGKEHDAHKGLFIRSQHKNDVKTVLFDFFLLMSLDATLEPNEMYKYIKAISPSWFLVAFRAGRWWRLTKEGKDKQAKWYSQEYCFSISGTGIITSQTKRTSNKRIPEDTVGLAASINGVVRIHRQPFYGMSKIPEYNYDGSSNRSEERR